MTSRQIRVVKQSRSNAGLQRVCLITYHQLPRIAKRGSKGKTSRARLSCFNNTNLSPRQLKSYCTSGLKAEDCLSYILDSDTQSSKLKLVIAERDRRHKLADLRLNSECNSWQKK